MEFPILFWLPGPIWEKVVVRHEIPDRCPYPIKFAHPTLYQWSNSYLLLQVVEGPHYFYALIDMELDEDVEMELELLQPTVMIQYSILGHAHAALQGHGAYPLIEKTYSGMYWSTGWHHLKVRAGRFAMAIIIPDHEQMDGLGNQHPEFRELSSRLTKSSWESLALDRFVLTRQDWFPFLELMQSNKEGFALQLELQKQMIALLSHFEETLRFKGQAFLNRRRDTFKQLMDEYIELNLSQPDKTSLETMASAFAFSKSTLHRNFVELYGHPPHEYIRSKRLQKADVLLREGINSISAIAEQVGYQDLASFSKQFKRQFGYSPEHVYKNNRGT